MQNADWWRFNLVTTPSIFALVAKKTTPGLFFAVHRPPSGGSTEKVTLIKEILIQGCHAKDIQ